MPRYPSLPRFRKTFFFAALFLFGNFLYPEFEIFDDQLVHVGQRYLIAGWNFNDLSDGYLSQFEVNHGVGILTSDWDTAAFSDFAGTTLNRFGADPAGRDFAFRNGAGFLNEGRGLTIRISMVNFANLAVSYATRRSASGFTDQEWCWSLDGENFVFHERLSAGDSYGLETIDFSDVKELSDVSEVFLRMELRGLPSNPSAAGNNRIDNLRLEATALRDTAGPGVLTVRNETEKDPLRGSDVFRLDLEQVVEFEIRGVEEAEIESITIKI